MRLKNTNTNSILKQSLQPVLLLFMLMLGLAANAQNIRYVKAGATGDGTSWENASGDVQAIIDASAAEEQVWIAKGDYSPATGQSFILKDGVQIYGGFPNSGTPAFTDRNFKNNETRLIGNGVRVVYCEFIGDKSILDGFTLTGGYDDVYGGAAIYILDSNVRLANLLITGNSAVQTPGVSILGGAPYLSHVRITNNKAYNQIGALSLTDSDAMLRDCLIDHNSVSPGGFASAVAVFAGAPRIVSCTIAKNDGGFWVDGNPAFLITNSIIWDNTGADGTAGTFYDTSTGTIIRASILEGSGGSSAWNENHYGYNGGNNIDANPVFTDPDNGDFSLFSNSPAINTGLNYDYTDSATSTDYNGDPRLFGINIDMGALEAQYNFSPVRYVKVGGTGDGTSWENASGDIQQMIDASDAGQKVWVAKGPYQRAAGESFMLKDGVKVYGGFPDAGDPVLADRNFTTNETSMLGNQATVITVAEGITASAVLDGFTVTGGASEGFTAGAIEITRASPTFKNIIISNNTSAGGPSAIKVDNGALLLYNSVIRNNTGEYASITINGTFAIETIIQNVLIANNRAVYGGGVMISGYNDNAGINAHLLNTTITNNIADIYPGGVMLQYVSARIENNIIWGNDNTEYSEVDFDNYGVSGTVSVSNSNIQGTGGSANWFTNYGADGGGNIDANPLFTNAANADYTLQNFSPSVNTGNTSLFTNATSAKDVAGNPRAFGTIDMGAYENQGFSGTIFYVRQGATGNGTSWNNAAGNLYAVMNAANYGSQVWVAAGNYTPVNGASFKMKENVKYYGGFPATGDPGIDNRDWVVNATTLTGNGSSVIKNDNNGLTEDAVLDGFIITGGSGVTYGGGIYNNNASPLLTNLVIKGNTASNGGGIAGNNSSASVINTIISNNTATASGGAIYYIDGAGTVTNTTIADNTAANNNILYFNNAATQIVNTIAWSTQPGTVTVTGDQHPVFKSSLVQGSNGSSTWNAAYGTDGGNNIDADPLFTNAAAFNYSIGTTSPAHNTGDAALFANAATAKDFTGYKRVDGGAIDMGAYEVGTDVEIRYVRQNAYGDGSSWDNASGNLQAMIDSSPARGQVWVGEGGFLPPAGQSFHMKENVAIYGGFPSSGNPAMADRNPGNYESVMYNNYNGTVILNIDNNLTHAAILDGFIIQNGGSDVYAGGIQNTNVSPTLRNLVISRNYGVNGGGYAEINSNAIVYNVVISGNNADSGGAISSENSTSVFTNLTIAFNYGYTGGGAFRHYNTASVINNSVIWDNSNNNDNGSDSVTLGMANGLTFTNCIVEGSGGSAGWNTAYGINGGNNIDADPLYTDYEFDYTVRAGSPAINRGNNALFPDAAAKDVAGNVRVFQNTIDMGAFEYQDFIANFYYVKQSGTGSGSSWADASGDLQLMINTAGEGDDIWVAAGTYTAAGTFTLKEAVSIYGGFPATGNPVMDNRNPAQYVSVLSSTTAPALTATGAAITTNTIIDGFSISGSGAAAVYIEDASPMLNHITVSNNSTAAISVTNSEAVINNLIANGNDGVTGTISISGASASGNFPSLTNSLIYANTTTGNGGGLYISNSSPVLTNVTVASNTAALGSGIYLNQASPVINNSIVYGNVNDNIAGQTSNAIFTSSLIGASGGSSNWNAAIGTDGGNNIDANPLFADTANGNYNLLAGSPAANTGDSSLFPDAFTSKDLAGNARVLSSGIDMGALESVSNTIKTYVKQDATGTGTSWTDATGNLEDAMANSGPGDEVWVAAGTYFPESANFTLKEGVVIYGGFPATGDPGMADRNFGTNVTTLRNNNSNTSTNYVIANSGVTLTNATVVDGFTITSADGVPGMGININNGSPVLRNLIVKNNNNGGIKLFNSSAIVTNVLVIDNSLGMEPAVNISGTSSPVFTNVTITDSFRATLELFGSGSPQFYNSIINVGISWSSLDSTTFTYCYVKNSGGSEDWYRDQVDGGHNIDGDLTILEDGSIVPGSIAINAGNNTYLDTAASPVDVAGNTRIYGDIIDLGAYEEQGAPSTPIRYVRVGGTGNGTSWAEASGNIQDMIDLSQSGNKILVATGTYSPDLEDYFEMKSGVSMYGGYVPTGDPAFEERDWAANPTILSGNEGGIIIAEELSRSTVLDGFVLTNSSGYYAAAIYSYDCSATFNNLVIRNNTGDSNAAVIYTDSGSPTFTNIVIYGNDVLPFYNYDSSPIFANVTVAGNTFDTLITNNASSGPIFINSIIWQDGAIVNEEGSNAVFYNNIVKNSGGSTAWTLNATDAGLNRDVEPLFTNPAGDDYTLQSGSPAIDNGISEFYEDIATARDLAGSNRLEGGSIDLGPYEKPALLCGTVTEWDGTAWSNGTPTAYTYSAVINGNYSSATNGEITACSLLVTSGNVTVEEGDAFVIKGIVVVTGGTMTIENNGSLIQEDDVDNIGSITVLKNSNALYRQDYTLWSSPVAGQKLLDFSPATLPNRFYIYGINDLGVEAYIATDASADFTIAKGYMIRMPNILNRADPDYAAYTAGTASHVFEGEFTGVPNNGYIETPMSIQDNYFSMVGNPYPSPINVQEFFDENESALSSNHGIYLWRKKNNGDATSYATLNKVAYVANDGATIDNANGTFDDENNYGGQQWEDYFATTPRAEWVLGTGQGFLVAGNGSGDNLFFTNQMRAEAASGQPFFRTNQNNPAAVSRLWLNMSSESNFSQAAIAYMDDATVGMDFGKDSKKFSTGLISLYTLADSQNLAIQTRPAFNDQDVVPVGYNAVNAGSYTISLRRKDGLFTQGQQVYLKDKMLGITHNFADGQYAFATEAGTFNERFDVVYATSTLGVQNPGTYANNIVIYKQSNTLHINCGKDVIAGVKIFDVRGRIVYQADEVNASATQISNLTVEQQVLIVQVTTTDNVTVSKKVIY